MSECIVRFAARQVQALTAAMERHGFIALCGPTGSGKHTLLQQAFRSTSVLRLECQVNGTNVRAVVKSMQPTLTTDGGARAVVWPVGLAELITESAVATLRTAAKCDAAKRCTALPRARSYTTLAWTTAIAKSLLPALD